MKPIHLMLTGLCLYLFASPLHAAEPMQWQIFETGFQSTAKYTNPVQEVRLEVVFTSPAGKIRTLCGFWDGGNEWKIRFSPDETGKWTYTTQCSNPEDEGLHNQSGSFVCKAYNGDLPLYQHGELQLAQNRRYIEHRDGTPFFWMADTVWCGPAFASLEDWTVFLEDRVEKKFTAIQFVLTQWRMFNTDVDGNPTFTGKEKIEINPAYFHRLDAYVDAINQKGLVAIPVLLWAIQGDVNPGYSLPEDQKILLADYMIARYGAHQVIWFLGGDGNYSGENAETWKRVGRAVFHKDQHRLATMHVGGKGWIAKEFRGEPWFDLLTYQSGHGDDEGTFRWLNQGPPSTDWNTEPILPVINAEPNYEGHNGYRTKKVHNDHSVRRACYWSLLVSPTAGVTYGGQGIWGWHTQVQVPAAHGSAGLGAPWWVAKDLPGAVQMRYLHEFFASIPWWNLAPVQDLLATQPGKDNAAEFVAVAKTPEGDTVVAYLPEGGKVELQTVGLAAGLKARWYCPRTGGWLDGGAVEKKPQQAFQAPDHNDWLLLLNK
ncbi:MAG: DUF4038 domain-containing protein [bacterium]|nr:DUF4038 domain-containing protein [bacterium]